MNRRQRRAHLALWAVVLVIVVLVLGATLADRHRHLAPWGAG